MTLRTTFSTVVRSLFCSVVVHLRQQSSRTRWLLLWGVAAAMLLSMVVGQKSFARCHLPCGGTTFFTCFFLLRLFSSLSFFFFLVFPFSRLAEAKYRTTMARCLDWARCEKADLRAGNDSFCFSKTAFDVQLSTMRSENGNIYWDLFIGFINSVGKDYQHVWLIAIVFTN